MKTVVAYHGGGTAGPGKGGVVKFDIQHKRSMMGNDVSVTVTAEGAERLGSVDTTFEGTSVAQAPYFPADTAYYKVDIVRLGYWGLGLQHEVVVTVVDADGTTRRAVHHWTDQ